MGKKDIVKSNLSGISQIAKKVNFVENLMKKDRTDIVSYNRNWWDKLSNKWRDILLMNHAIQKNNSLYRFSVEMMHPKNTYFRFSNIFHVKFEDYKYLVNDKLISEIKELKIIDCQKMSLTDLEPLSELKKLRYINCSNNKIRNLDAIKKLNKLRILDCSYNPYMENINGINKFKKLEVLLLHNLPNLRACTLKGKNEILRVLTINYSPINLTNKVANRLYELSVNELDLQKLPYKFLYALRLNPTKFHEDEDEDADEYEETVYDSSVLVDIFDEEHKDDYLKLPLREYLLNLERIIIIKILWTDCVYDDDGHYINVLYSLFSEDEEPSEVCDDYWSEPRERD